MTILIDNNLPPDLTTALLLQNISAVHVRSLGLGDASDYRILEEAKVRGDVVLTRDNDFPQILALTGSLGPSIILIRQGEPTQIAQVVDLVTGIPPLHLEGLENGAVVSIDERGYRMRRLPFR